MIKGITKLSIKFGIISLMLVGFLSSTAFGQANFDKQVEQFTHDLGTELAQAGKRKIAVLDFADIDGKVNRLGKVIAEDITVNLLSQRRSFETVDRLHLSTLLKKYNLSNSALTDPETIKQIGRLVGVDAIIMGNFTDFGTSLRVTGKVYDAQTAKMIRASKIYLQKEGVVLNLLGASNTNTSNSNTNTEKKEEEIKKPSVSLINNFVFQLQETRREGSKVVCNFMVTNKGRSDRKLVLYASSNGRSFAFAANGSRFEAKINRLGNQQRGYSVSQMLIRNVPVNAQITFENVPANTTIFNLLELNMETFKVRFNNVEIAE
jgi:TolB-like protein